MVTIIRAYREVGVPGLFVEWAREAPCTEEERVAFERLGNKALSFRPGTDEYRDALAELTVYATEHEVAEG
jgi:hypothetical protein